MIVCLLHFISTPGGVGKWLLPALGACLLHQEHVPTLLLPLQPLSLTFSLWQAAHWEIRSSKECYFCVNSESTALDYLWSLERGSSCQAPYELRTGNLGVFTVFWGVGVLFDQLCKRGRKTFLPRHIHMLCVFNSHMLGPMHVCFRGATPWNIC